MLQEVVIKDDRVIRLRPATEGDAAQLVQAVDSVAREGLYFLRSRFDVDVEKERTSIIENREKGNLMLVAVLDGKLVGWLSMFRGRAEFLHHTAELGMGVIQGFRGIGIGAALMDYALRWAAEHRFEKINLGVRASNERARALYRKFGFVEEGYRVREIKDLEDRYHDSVEMAYFVPQNPPLGAKG
jgi:ribosomal protein S18 acetylase RimI-like enzyme